MNKKTVAWALALVCCVLFAYPAFMSLPVGNAFLNMMAFVALELGILIALLIGLSDPGSKVPGQAH